VLDARPTSEVEVGDQRRRIAAIVERARSVVDRAPEGAEGDVGDVRDLMEIVDALVPKSTWIVGGDGWAYDIGFGGLDHVLGSGRNVNVLVLDTEAYSNTGGQASKATPRGAVAKFASSGKETPKKDLGAIARAYGNVYVAQVAVGANDTQTVKSFLEADAWPGPSLVIAYSTCIAHGIDMSTSMSYQKDATRSGYWPLYRYRPSEDDDATPMRLDSTRPTVAVADFVAKEARFAILARTDPERAAHLAGLLQADIDERWHYYEQLAGLHRSIPHVTEADEAAAMDHGEAR
jgi:pyruvate-ferredoxin/flavodoxin oxidoreductase